MWYLHHFKNKIKNEENKLFQSFILLLFHEEIFSSKLPYFTTKSEWKNEYDNFRILRGHNCNNTHKNNSRSETKNDFLSINNNDSTNLVTPSTTNQ